MSTAGRLEMTASTQIVGPGGAARSRRALYDLDLVWGAPLG
jgi:hypothetical protein